MLARREVNDAVDATQDADDSAILQVLDEELRRVSRERRLLRREVPILSDRKLEEAVPVGSRLDVTRHGMKRNQRFSCVQAPGSANERERSSSIRTLDVHLGKTVGEGESPLRVVTEVSHLIGLTLRGVT